MTIESLKWRGEFGSTPDQHALKRRMILREAGQAFNARGYSDVSLDQVAARLGISKTVCYYYFKDKNDLLMCCAEIGLEIYEHALDVGEAMEGAAIDRLVEFVRTYVRGIMSENGMGAMFNDLYALRPESLELIRKRQRKAFRRLRRLLEQGVEDGSVVAENLIDSANWLLSAPLMVRRLAEAERGRDYTHLAENYAMLARRSLEPRSTSHAPAPLRVA